MLPSQELLEWLIAFAGAITACGVIALTALRVVRKLLEVVKLLQRLASLVDSLQELVEKLPARDLHIVLGQIEQRLCLLEQKHSHIFDAIADCALFECAADGTCIYTSSRWSEMTGILPQEAEGLGWLSTVHPDDRVRVREEWENTVQSKTEFDMNVRYVRRRDRGLITLHIRIIPIRARDGAVLRFIGIARRLEDSYGAVGITN